MAEIKFLQVATERDSRTEILLTHFRILTEEIVSDRTQCLLCAAIDSDVTDFFLSQSEDYTPPIVKSVTELSSIVAASNRPLYSLRSTLISMLTFRHRASCILGQAFHYSPEKAFYMFNQQIYFII